MIVTEKIGKVVTGGKIKTTGFNIKATRKAFQILSSGLYSDKVRAILRELGTNAADAHIMAGKRELPFAVHLPNKMEPHYSITDYGTGLSDEAMRGYYKDENGNKYSVDDVPEDVPVERVEGIYTTYFDSDKTETNEATGCLGLGSKSPFSYTDSFTVESRYNGMKNVYTAFINEDGMPDISRLASVPSDEPNGLTVQFPVKSGDFYEFQSKAEETYQWFKVRPKITGAHVTFEDREYLRKTDKYGVYQSKTHSSYVVMGNIAYPLSVAGLGLGYADDDNRLRKIIEWGVEIYVNIGDVDMAASREALSYDKPTVKYLRETLWDAMNDLEAEITKEIASQPTLWQARRTLHRIRQSFTGFDLRAEYNGARINDYVNVGKRKEQVGAVEVEIPQAVVERMKIKSWNTTRLVVGKDRAEKIFADGTVVFLADAKGSIAAVRRYLAGKSNGTLVYLIHSADADWLKSTGLDEIVVKTSSLPKPPRAVGERGKASRAKVFRFVPSGNADNGSTSASRYWMPAEIDLDEEDGIFVEILYFNWRNTDGEQTHHPHNLKNPLSMLEGVLGKDVPIYGVRPSDRELFDNAEGEWLTLKDAIKQQAEAQEAKFADAYAKREQLRNVASGYYVPTVPVTLFDKTVFSYDSVFGKYIAAHLEAKQIAAMDGLDEYVNLLEAAGVHKEVDNVNALEDMRKEVFQKYPMLQYIQMRGDDEFSKNYASYVRMIDG
jgi:hypothetical protein